MTTVWAIVLIVFGLVLCWLGQLTSALAPKLAERIGLQERESDLDPAVHADARGEAIWDAAVLWVLPVAGFLLLLEHPWWRIFGLVGGGMYIYFAGRIVLTRLLMSRRGIRVGSPTSVRVAYGAALLWGLMGFVTVLAAAWNL